MYLSCLLIHVGDNADRPRPGRLWLRNLYHVHQRLCMAFPSISRKSDDGDFLKHFTPQEFGSEQVHVARAADSGFLFRIDPQLGGRVVILVQSAVKPDWGYAFHNAGYLLAAPPEVMSFTPCFMMQQHLRFRLVANPTRKIDTKSGPDGQKRNGKRVPVPEDCLFDWLARKAEQSGFSIEASPGESTTAQPGYIYVNKTPDGEGHRLYSVRYKGILNVTDPVRFHKAIIHGIGPGKAYGFGLLSVAPAR